MARTRPFTQKELKAISHALAIALAGEVIDGLEDDTPEEAEVRAAMESAQQKVWERRK